MVKTIYARSDFGRQTHIIHSRTSTHTLCGCDAKPMTKWSADEASIDWPICTACLKAPH